MRHRFLTFILALITASLASAKFVTVNLPYPGMLDYELAKQAKWPTVDSLKIEGNINGTDIRAFRRMAYGWDPVGDFIPDNLKESKLEPKNPIPDGTDGRLRYLDLSDANIVEGGDYYALISRYEGKQFKEFVECRTRNDVIGIWMLDGYKLQKVILPKSVTSIEPFALGGDYNLKTLEFNDGITEIQGPLFSPYSGGGQRISLTELKMPANLQIIGERSFYKCESLRSLHLPESVWFIGDEAFADCEMRLSPVLLSNLSYIGRRAFAGCTFEESETLTIPSLIYFGDDAVSLNTESLNFTFSRSRIRDLQQNAIPFSKEQPFYIGKISGTSLTVLRDMSASIVNPALDGDTIVLGKYALADNRTLKTATLPKQQYFVASDYAFCNCTSLGSVSMVSLNPFAVEGCANLKTLEFRDADVNRNAVDNYESILSTCSKLENFTGPAIKNVKNGLATDKGCLFYVENGNARLLKFPCGRQDITYKESFDNAMPGAFNNCGRVRIFDLMTGKFPAREMQNFPGLKSITVRPSTGYTIIDGLVYEKGGLGGEVGALVCYPDYIQMPRTMTYIGGVKPFAYYGKYKELEKVVIPRDVVDASGLLPNATNLTMIVCESDTPPTIDETSFSTAKTKVETIVLVPKGAYANYKNTQFWNEFNIVEYDGVDAVESNDVKVTTNGQTLTVTGAAEGARLEVYTVDGRMIYCGTERIVELPSRGMYVVRIGFWVKKIVAR